ncbi:efflux RND transporter periplasmic adaptor subunit [soil metagenome]
MKYAYIALYIFFATPLYSCKENMPVSAEVKAPLVTDSLAKIITIDTVKNEPIEGQLSLSGEVSYDDNKVVRVFPNASGQVVKVNVSLGDHVHRGQTLAVIKSADVAGNYADLVAANNDAAIAKKELDNAEQLYKNGINSEKELVQARLQYEKAMAAVNKIKSSISINGGGNTDETGTYIITAPMDGFIVDKNLNAGSFIRNDNGQNLFTISGMQDVWVWANVFETDIEKVKEGYPADVSTLAYPGKIFHGKIDQVNAVLDPLSKAMKIKIVLPNAGMLLKPQMFTKVIIAEKESATALSVPGTALVFNGGKNYVLVYQDAYHVSIREVEPLKVVGEKTYIASGLSAGEKIISRNQILLYNSLNGD